ncbi:MAG: alpha amylase catalytic region [Pedosphaera sp.]|nr:alpha amylase catalytic region [Pedosphaera sp.]
MSNSRLNFTAPRKRHLLTKVFGLLTLFALSTSSLFSGVMMQGFYWDVPGPWYPTMEANAAALKNMVGGYGINRIWFPVPQKSASGGFSMGYDPFDYYDLGSYTQKGGPGTHFGTQAQLKSAIAAYHAQGISCMADVVLNHRSGGANEANGYTGGTSYTDFNAVQSGLCKWHWYDFHPNFYEVSDEGTFGGYQDVTFNSGAPYGAMKTWLSWLKNSANAGFDGWRYDYTKGYHSWVVNDMNAASGPDFTVGEYWDANTTLLDNWANAANAHAFDFAAYYTLKNICNNTGGGGNMPDVFDATKCYAAKNAGKAVTFVANHDTDEIISDKMMAYAFIMTYQGYPCIFWKDYYNYGLATGGGNGSGWGNGINKLVWMREKFANGGPNIHILESQNSQYIIYEAYGSSASQPGYIVIINDDATQWKGQTITVANGYVKNKTLKAYAWSSSKSGQNTPPADQFCNSAGSVQVWAAPRGYAVYTVTGF